MSEPDERRDDLTRCVLGGAFAVHTAMRPGLLESAYEACLEHELRLRGLRVERQRVLGLEYRGCRIDQGYRIDLLVDDALIVEVKAVRRILPAHRAQLLSYLKLSGVPVGLLLNFHALRLKDGMERFVGPARRAFQ